MENRDYPQGHYLQSVLNAVLDIDSGKTLADSEGGDPKKIIEQARLKVITETVDRLSNEQATHE